MIRGLTDLEVGYMKTTCVQCGVEFEQSRKRGRPRKYCEAHFRVRASRYTPKPVALVEIACKWCEGTFVGDPPRRYCSDVCKRAFMSRPKGECSSCGGAVHIGRSSRPNPICLPCRRAAPGYQPGGALKPKTSVTKWDCAYCGIACERPATKGQAPKYCGDRCGWLARDRVVGICEFCGDEYTGTGLRFCSVQCFGRSNRHFKSTEVVHVGPVPSRWADAPPTPVAVVSSPKWWAVIIQGPCSWCGEPFAAPTGSGRASFCSKRCSSGFHKSKRRFNPSPRFRLSIYERDKWTCQLCFEPIDRDAHYLNDWAPSLDHIECQSWALLPVHSPENLRTCHRFCNAVRGDGTYHADFFEGVSA